ncbi:MAG TPA: xanthine dehydrogenase family protein molybdopterin-binding subunit [Terriglobales bacterium]|nr:xanthine dehydrogenase family protein molybdopterin-binding subunit [Terriglobales bacterium]
MPPKTPYAWPDAPERKLIGKRVSRVDGPVKVSGRAKYTYDVHPQGMLYARMLGCPHAHARITSIDTSAAERLPGVRAVHIVQKEGTEIYWAGDEVVAVAADTESILEQALNAVKVQYEVLPHLVSDHEPPANIAVATGPASQDDLRDMFENQVPDEEIISYVKTNGINFRPSADYLKTLASYEVPKPVIDAIGAAPVKEGVKKAPTLYRKSSAQVQGDPDSGFKQPGVVTSEGVYGAAVIAHCCLEAHGTVCEWPDQNNLNVHISTQNVSGIAAQMAEPLGMTADRIHVHMDHIGGGFGSKFGPDRWGIVNAELSRKAGGKPVRLMLERDREMEVAGARPSAYARVKVAAQKDGTIVAWDSQGWGTGGPGGGGTPPIPYVFEVPDRRTQYTAIVNHIGPARAWRAPNHPQAAVITMGALDDLAAELNMDPLDFFTKNIAITGPRSSTYEQELRIAADLMGWKKLWRNRRQNAESTDAVKRGVGLSIHTWGGRGHNSDCDLTIHPDGAVEIKMGSQDLGTGTRTAILMVAADTLGLPMSQINLLIGDNKYPPSGGSGGSTTIGGVSSSTRRAAVDARAALLEKVAPALNAQPAELEVVDGTVRVKAAPTRSLSWKQACQKIGPVPLTVRGKNPDRSKPPDLTSAGVGGVQMADVSVDTETGIVKVNKMVAVQDCGLIIDLKTAESQVHGALIMGISYALFEEKIYDPTTGRMLNPNMQYYRLAGIGDIPELVVHMMTGKGFDERGVIGLGEPPVVSPGAAIANAVANAIGTRVGTVPLTPERVLAALERSRLRD